QAVVIGCLLYFRMSVPHQLAVPVVSASTLSGADVKARIVAPNPAPTPAADEARKEAGASTNVASAPQAAKPAVTVVAGATVRIGGVRVISPIELVVLDGDHVLGSSADGSIVAAPGRRELELVNTSLGYRVRQTVDI